MPSKKNFVLIAQVLVTITLLLCTFTIVSAASKPPYMPFSDGFNSRRLRKGWTILDPAGGSTFSLTDNPKWLRITTFSPPMRDLWGPVENAPRIMLDVFGDFIVETKMKATTVSNDEGGGILIWISATNYLLLQRMARTIGNPVQQQIVFRNRDSSALYIITLSSYYDTTYLKVVRTGNTFLGYYSWDGETWTLAGTITDSATGSISIGLHVIHMYHDGTFYADFDYFKMTANS